MAVRDAGPQALALGRPSAEAGHVGRGPRFVDEHELGRVEIELSFEPGLATLQDIRAVLLGRVRGLFLSVIRCRSKKRHSVP